MADNTYYGAGTYGQGNYQPYQVAPDPIGDGEAVGAPAVVFSGTTSTPSIGDQETVGTPTAATTSTTAPSSINNTDAVGVPTATVVSTTAPTGTADADAVALPTASVLSTTAPSGTADAETIGTPAAVTTFTATATASSINDTDAVGLPTATVGTPTAPAATADAETIGTPAAATTLSTTPTQIADTAVPGNPSAAFALTSTPTSVADAVTVGTPSAAGTSTTAPGAVTDTDTITGPATSSSSQAGPGTATDPESTGAPAIITAATVAPTGYGDTDTVTAPAVTASTTAATAAISDTETAGQPSLGGDTFSTGIYGTGIYYGAAGMPDQITYPGTISDTDTTGDPLLLITLTAAPDPAADTEIIGNPATSLATSVAPDPAADPETLGTPQTGTSFYNDGPYGEGVYAGLTLPDDQTADPTPVGDFDNVGAPVLSFTAGINQNNIYNGGLYGEGIYFGSADSADPDDPGFTEAEPLWPPRPYNPPTQPQQILGIGPWSDAITWRGAPNYGAPAGKLPARPAIALPTPVSSSFTLRVNAASEASASFEFSRANTAIPEEMSTDLWWRRRDPLTKTLEMIGRFNTSQSDVSSTDVGVQVNTQFTCYRTLLGDRLVINYKDVANSENLWDTGTPVVEIMRFAVPDNMGLDLSGIDISDPYRLGTTTQPFEIALGSTVDEVFNNLLDISRKAWEWWVDTPLDVTVAPKLAFAVGTRGSDRGVTLFDGGTGPTDIAQWSMANYVSRYANSLYFIGRDGGETAILDEQVALYGQRDASDSDSSVPGTKSKTTGLPTQLDTATATRLAALADRRPTYTIQLRTGFWRGRTHIDAGDTVGVYIRLGSQVLQGKYRCTELQVDIDGNGVENVTLTLGKPLTSGDPRSRHSAMSRIVARLKNYERKGP